MVAAPFSLGFCRRLIRLDRGADLIGRSRVRPANSTRRIWNTKRTACVKGVFERMTIQRMDHVGVVVDDLAAATAFFVELGLELQGETRPKANGWTASSGSRASGWTPR